MEWIREPMEVNMPKSVSWCPCMGAKCRGNNPPFCSIKTSNCKSVQTECLKQALQKAEAVIIGAGAGLSTSAGFTYSGERFEKWFGDFRQVHGFSDMYSGGFFPYKTLEEYWAYWSRYIYMQPGRMQFMPAKIRRKPVRRRKSERNPFAWKRILEQFWKNCMIGKIVGETLRYPKRYAKILDNILYKNK